MARMVSLGAGLQDIYLIDHDDLGSTKIGSGEVLGKLTPGSKVDIDRIAFKVGGGGVNSAITLARHGHEAIFMGNIARDAAGSAIIRKLDQENVDTSYINFLESRSTGASIILLDTKSGERTILTCRGGSSQFGNFSEHDLDLVQPDYLYVTTLRGDFDSLNRFFKRASDIGATIMFNPGVKELDHPNELTSLLKYVNILLLNKSEASRIVPGALLTELLDRLKNYVDITLITDGSMGGIATDGRDTYRFGVYEDCKIKDATGAGDAFGAGFLAQYAMRHDFRSSLIFASANSTSVVSKIGGSTGALTGHEILHPMPIQQL